MTFIRFDYEKKLEETRKALKESGGDIIKTAKALGVHPATISARIKKYRLNFLMVSRQRGKVYREIENN